MVLKTTKNTFVLRRVLATVGCVLAFAVMASVFSPDRTRAGDINDPWRGIPPKSVEYAPPGVGASSILTDTDSIQAPSVDPHEGLCSLGTIEDLGYTVHIFATEGGPRFTVYEKATGRQCGALLSAAQVHQAFPDLQLPTMEFDASQPLMLADSPDDLRW